MVSMIFGVYYSFSNSGYDSPYILMDSVNGKGEFSVLRHFGSIKVFIEMQNVQKISKHGMPFVICATYI